MQLRVFRTILRNGIAMGLWMFLVAQATLAADPGRRVAAVVDGETIYTDELIGRELHDLRKRLFEAESVITRSRVLDRLRTSRPDEFPMPQVVVTEEEIAKLYEEANLSDRGSLELLVDQIRLYLEQQKREEAEETQLQIAMNKGYVTQFLEPPPGFFLTVELGTTAHTRGENDAAVTIVEFSDFQCPFCNRAQPVIAEVLHKYKGQVKLVYRHLPLSQIHPRAQALAEAAECAAEQQEFWAYHDLIFDHFEEVDTVDMFELAETAGVDDARRFRQCVEEGTYADRVMEDQRIAESLGIGGTPSFIIGPTTPEGTVKGTLLQGMQSSATFEQAIDQALARH